VTRSITGVAFYGSTTSTEHGEDAFAIGMGSLKADSSFKDMVAIVRGKRGVPAVGTYQLHDASSDGDLADDDFVLISVLETTGGQSMLCFATGGTVTVQSTSGGRVKGNYNAQAGCLDPSNFERDVTVTLSGSFDAIEGSRVTVPSSARLGATGAGVAGARFLPR
jgi:hypothetical protein